MSSTNDDYVRQFDPYEYLNYYYTDIKYNTHSYQLLAKFWSQHKGKDLRVLEYGGGPVVSRLVSACPYVKEFVFADYLESNRKAVQAWIDKDSKAFDWTSDVAYIVQELEGKGREVVAERVDELRQKIRAIVPCDIRAEEILEVPTDLQDEYGPPYDVVNTAFCIEDIVENNEQYKTAWRKLAKLVKPGGYVVMRGTLEETYYTVGSNIFHHFYLTKDLLEETMKELGLKEIKIDLSSQSNVSIEEKKDGKIDAKDFFFAVGRV